MANKSVTSADLSNREAISSDIANNSEFHKSLDFSNIGLYRSGNTSDDKDFRKFHQMTLYIQVPSVYNHGESKSMSGKTIMITSNLPESISYNLGSKWEAPLSGFGGGATNLMMQMLGPKLLGKSNIPSGISRATSLKVWGGTEPLQLDLTIPVLDDVETDSKTNLMEALEILGSLVLPSRTSNWGFYTPPPSPLNATIKLTSETNFKMSSTYGRIMLQLGGMLLVDKCIIESVNVSYPNTKAMIKHSYTTSSSGEFLHPLYAVVKLKIGTIEALTSEAYSKMLWAKPQPHSGSLTADFSWAGDAVINAFK